MECKACGFNDKEQKDKPYEEKFIRVEGHFTTVQDSGYHQNRNEIYLYACPKCGTIRTSYNDPLL